MTSIAIAITTPNALAPASAPQKAGFGPARATPTTTSRRPCKTAAGSTHTRMAVRTESLNPAPALGVAAQAVSAGSSTPARPPNGHHAAPARRSPSPRSDRVCRSGDLARSPEQSLQSGYTYGPHQALSQSLFFAGLKRTRVHLEWVMTRATDVVAFDY